MVWLFAGIVDNVKMQRTTKADYSLQKLQPKNGSKISVLDVSLCKKGFKEYLVESWMSARAIDVASKSVLPASSSSKPVLPPRPDETSKLYNAMVSPFDRMSVRAMVWYQGEANADQNIALGNARWAALWGGPKSGPFNTECLAETV